MSWRLKLLLVVVALAATAAGAVVASRSGSTKVGSSAGVKALKPSQTNLESCASHFELEAENRENRGGQGELPVPPKPQKALICRYYGYPESVPTGGDTEGKIGLLAAEGVVSSGRAAEFLAQAFDELKAVPPGEYTCPEDRGAALYVLFAYRAAPTVRVLVRLGGCEFVGSNATAGGFALAPGLRRHLTELAS